MLKLNDLNVQDVLSKTAKGKALYARLNKSKVRFEYDLLQKGGLHVKGYDMSDQTWKSAGMILFGSDTAAYLCNLSLPGVVYRIIEGRVYKSVDNVWEVWPVTDELLADTWVTTMEKRMNMETQISVLFYTYFNMFSGK